MTMIGCMPISSAMLQPMMVKPTSPIASRIRNGQRSAAMKRAQAMVAKAAAQQRMSRYGFSTQTSG